MSRSLTTRGPWSQFRQALRGEEAVLIGLDLDGTLARIADHPERARVLPRVLRVLEKCIRARGTHVAIVSARPLVAMRRLLPIAGLHRVGQYGLEGILAPATARRAALRRTTTKLARQATLEVARIPGAWVERKGLTFAVHDRAVAPANRPALARIVRRLAAEARRRGFRPVAGHRVTDFVPAGFDKGTALRGVIRELEPDRTLYFGDSAADEPAFGVLGSSDFAIRVGPGATRAPFRIGGPDDVARVLRAVVELRNGAAPASRR